MDNALTSSRFSLRIKRVAETLLHPGSGFDNRPESPFRVLISKEITDHFRSFRFPIMITLIGLTMLGSLYSALSGLSEVIKPDDPAGSFLFLKLYSLSNGSMPSYLVFIGFLGPLLGISLGFDSINLEQSRGTMSRLLAQPIYRDDVIHAKFIASLAVISILFLVLAFIYMGIGMVILGLPPTPEEFIRILIFVVLSIVYVAFWLNLSILFSVHLKQPATSALAGIAVWLFFTVFFPLIVNMVFQALEPHEGALNAARMFTLTKWKQAVMRLAPNVLFSEATSVLLTPTVRSIGPLSIEQLHGSIPGALPLGQSLLLIWAHVTALISETVVCFIFAYVPFMRREIRSR